MTERHDPYAALRVPDYRRLLCSTVLGTVASEMRAVAVGWDLYQRTGSKAALGLVGLAQFLPVLLFFLPAGHVADRFNRKLIIIGALALSAITSTGLTIVSLFGGPVHFIYLCIAMVGIAQAFSAPARWSLLPSVISDDLLPAAVTWNSSAWQIAAVVGPALGAVVMSASSGAPGPVYGFAACLSLCSAVFLVPVRPRPRKRTAEPATLKSLLAGLRFVLKTDMILATITLDLFAVLLGGATILLPVFVKDILQVDVSWVGWLRSAPSVGAMLMAFTLAHRPPLRRAGPALLWAVAGFGAATIVFGISRSPWLSFAMLAVTGALDNISVVVRATLIQVLTPESMRGRVTAVNLIFIGSSNELGAFESGITAAWFGPVLSVVGGGIGSILVVLAVMFHWPQILRLGSLASLAASCDTAAVDSNQRSEVRGQKSVGKPV
jgi:MFS family permease